MVLESLGTCTLIRFKAKMTTKRDYQRKKNNNMSAITNQGAGSQAGGLESIKYYV